LSKESYSNGATPGKRPNYRASGRADWAGDDSLGAKAQRMTNGSERHDAEMKLIIEAIAADSKNVRALARIAELHNR
jgi:hypothetical protein